MPIQEPIVPFPPLKVHSTVCTSSKALLHCSLCAGPLSPQDSLHLDNRLVAYSSTYPEHYLVHSECWMYIVCACSVAQSYPIAQSCPTLCSPMDYSLSGFFVHGIFQARILEWVAIPYSRGSSQLRDRTQVSYIGRQVLYHYTTREARNGACLAVKSRLWSYTTWVESRFCHLPAACKKTIS